MARSTLSKVKLVKTGDKPAEGWWNTDGKYRDTDYAVVHGRKVIGGVGSTWGRADSIERFWRGFDPNGSNVLALGWTDYRDDAVDAVVRAAGLK